MCTCVYTINTHLYLAKLYKKPYTTTIGSATPTINRGCPPTTAYTIPQIPEENSVYTAVIFPLVVSKSYCPKINAGIALAKNIYAAGANIYTPLRKPKTQSYL